MGEALRLPSKFAGACKRAEEVGSILVGEPSSCTIRIDRHAADRIGWEPSVDGFTDSDCCKNLDWIADVA